VLSVKRRVALNYRNISHFLMLTCLDLEEMPPNLCTKNVTFHKKRGNSFEELSTKKAFGGITMDHNYTHDTQYAGLAALAAWLQQNGIWQTVADNVVIRQKTVKHRPIDKLLDVFIHILTGEQRLVTMNTSLRCDEGLQRAFGRETCVEQSLASTTLDRCDEETVAQMYEVFNELMREHSRSYNHDYNRYWQVLDVDMTGLLAGIQAEGCEKGYFANKRGARGRQLGRVLASNYGEVVYERLYDGRAHLESKLEELVIEAMDVLALDEEKRQHTLLRIDGAGGSDQFINWVLELGFGILTKVHNWKRSAKLAQSVQKWHVDPRDDGREVGWVTAPHPYICPTYQLAVRKRNKKGQWVYSVLVTNLSPQALRWLLSNQLPANCRKQTERCGLFSMPMTVVAAVWKPAFARVSRLWASISATNGASQPKKCWYF
jgi:hypothetical protein